jgi:hypothetical protein
MSQKLVSLNPDLSRLRADGLDISIGRSKHLLTGHGPSYVASRLLSTYPALLLALAPFHLLLSQPQPG